LIDPGFIQSKADYSLFTRTQGSSFIALLLYVNDIAITSNDSAAVKSLIVTLNDRFQLKDLGVLRYFLGLEIARSDKGISVINSMLVKSMCEFNMFPAHCLLIATEPVRLCIMLVQCICFQQIAFPDHRNRKKQ
jgi:hypothetical protein